MQNWACNFYNKKNSNYAGRILLLFLTFIAFLSIHGQAPGVTAANPEAAAKGSFAYKVFHCSNGLVAFLIIWPTVIVCLIVIFVVILTTVWPTLTVCLSAIFVAVSAIVLQIIIALLVPFFVLLTQLIKCILFIISITGIFCAAVHKEF